MRAGVSPPPPPRFCCRRLVFSTMTTPPGRAVPRRLRKRVLPKSPGAFATSDAKSDAFSGVRASDAGPVASPMPTRSGGWCPPGAPRPGRDRSDPAPDHGLTAWPRPAAVTA